MAKEKIENSAFQEVINGIPAGGFFMNFINNEFPSFSDHEIEIKKADFDIETKQLNLEFSAKIDDEKVSFNIGSKDVDGGMLYFLSYANSKKKYTITYQVEDK